VLPAGTCKPAVNNAKTTTHPALTVVDLASGAAVTSMLDKGFESAAGSGAVRVPLLPTDLAFKNDFAYVLGEGADAAFRLSIDPSNGDITAFGSTSPFIDLRTSTDATIRLPIGIAISRGSSFAVVANDGNRDVEVINFNAQAVVDAPTVHSSALPPANSAAESALRGKRFFNTGLGRWSLGKPGKSGEAWGSCGACHVDGLSDDVTWYFARGPRQTVSLDGTYASGAPADQRILNWSGIADEIADFEGNTRGVSGGVGALVSTVSSPPAASDRINLGGATPQQGLQGSSTCVASSDAECPSSGPHSAIEDWLDLDHWIQTLRSPRAPTNLVQADVAAGKALFADAFQANCVGCHSGPKWTISRVFYAPDDNHNDPFGASHTANVSLSATSWNQALNGFPAALFPSSVAANQMDRVGAPPGFEQLGCAVRPVGTIGALSGGVPAGVSAPDIHVLELRADMVTGGQGSGLLANEPTAGFNVPSLLGVQVGAPYFHAGNARTLEELFASRFGGHTHSAVAQIFSPSAGDVRALTAYVLSIDESTPAIAVPAKGGGGGDLCVAPN
jgi:cytochrome c553